MRGALLVAGTHSGVGKSLLVRGLCRWLARSGVRVAPFKAQNMSLNSAVTPDGREIAWAQAAQAEAAGAIPEASMNPVLLKPSRQGRCQVVVMGKALGEFSGAEYLRLRPALKETVLSALEELRSRFDVVVAEGAGSPAEVNLREGDLVNTGLARAAGLPVLLVGDLDRGGALASLYGTLALLEPEDRDLVKGFVLNRFRGDPAILAPGLEVLEERTGRPVLGVLPYLEGPLFDAEDSLSLASLASEGRARAGDVIHVVLVHLPHISNFTDFEPFAVEPGVCLHLSRSPAQVLGADLAILPGTKATVDDLAWLRAVGLDRVLEERARRGLPVLGICGGYQMLGEVIEDPVESGVGRVKGLGLLPVETRFLPEKVLAERVGFSPWLGVPVSGYEIRHGRPEARGGEVFITSGEGEEGCRRGAVVGTSWHGLFRGDSLRRAFLSWVAEVRGLEWWPGERSFASLREEAVERIARAVESSLNLEAIMAVLSGAAGR